jgi:hypothetical protein
VLALAALSIVAAAAAARFARPVFLRLVLPAGRRTVRLAAALPADAIAGCDAQFGPWPSLFESGFAARTRLSPSQSHIRPGPLVPKAGASGS